MFIQVVAMLAAVGSPTEPRPLVTFSAYPQLRHVITQIEVGLLSGPREHGAEGRAEYWFKRTVRPDDGDVVETQWTDTRRCPNGRAVLTALAALTPVQPMTYALDGNDDLAVSVDGTTYRLETQTAAPYVGGRMELRTNAGSPLGRWVETSFTQLAGCWSGERPVFGPR